MIQNVNLNGL